MLAGAAMILCTLVYGGVMFCVGIDTRLRVILENLLCSLTCYAFCLVPTYWINKQYEKQQAWNIQYNEMREREKSQSIIYLPLEELLSTTDGFDLFADHLVKEFSIENLFFVFEVIQIQNEVLKHQYLHINKQQM